MRLDAIARALQDIAMADVCDAGLDEPAWIVRRTRVQVARFPRYLERLDVATYCWSMGKFAAERRTAMVGSDGGRLDTLTLWVRLDPARGRPAGLAPAFRDVYAEVVEGRLTNHDLRHDAPPARMRGTPWPLRACDFDLRGHVNNAVCWAALEEVLAADAEPSAGGTFEMEFRAAIAPGAKVEIVRGVPSDDRTRAMWLVADQRACASALAWGPAI